MIKELIQQGIPAEDFERVIYPGHSEQTKKRIAKTIANSFSAVFGMKRSKVTLTPAKEAKSASDEAASGAATVAESIDELRDALQNGIPHRRILNLRQVMPRVGQKIQVTCPTHNIYWSRPGRSDPRKVIEDYYLDAAALGKQHEVLELVEGDVGRAHYYAAKVNIAKPTDEGPRMAYINIRLRFFETDRDGHRHWTSNFNTMWFCKTLVDDSYFRAPDGVASKRHNG